MACQDRAAARLLLAARGDALFCADGDEEDHLLDAVLSITRTVAGWQWNPACREALGGDAAALAASVRGVTVLHVAAVCAASAVPALLAHGSDVRATTDADVGGDTPLHWAVHSFNGDASTVVRLLAAGACARVGNAAGVSSLELSRRLSFARALTPLLAAAAESPRHLP